MTPVEGSISISIAGLWVDSPSASFVYGLCRIVVPFAFAIAGLLRDCLLGSTVEALTAVSWSFLTLGILLGSWWAYYELGGAVGGSGIR